MLEDVGVTTVLVPPEIVRSGLAAQVAVDALVIDVEFARDVLRIFICYISHMNKKVMVKNMETGLRDGKSILTAIFSPPQW